MSELFRRTDDGRRNSGTVVVGASPRPLKSGDWAWDSEVVCVRVVSNHK